MSDEEPYIPTLRELEADFREMDFRLPRACAIVAKVIGLYLTYVMREPVRWDPERTWGDQR